MHIMIVLTIKSSILAEQESFGLSRSSLGNSETNKSIKGLSHELLVNIVVTLVTFEMAGWLTYREQLPK
jgi:hypothetical protein